MYYAASYFGIDFLIVAAVIVGVAVYEASKYGLSAVLVRIKADIARVEALVKPKAAVPPAPAPAPSTPPPAASPAAPVAPPHA